MVLSDLTRSASVIGSECLEVGSHAKRCSNPSAIEFTCQVLLLMPTSTSMDSVNVVRDLSGVDERVNATVSGDGAAWHTPESRNAARVRESGGCNCDGLHGDERPAQRMMLLEDAVRGATQSPKQSNEGPINGSCRSSPGRPRRRCYVEVCAGVWKLESGASSSCRNARVCTAEARGGMCLA